MTVETLDDMKKVIDGLSHTASIAPNNQGHIGIRGILAIEGELTGDGRKIQTNAVYWDNAPWSLMAQINNEGHDGAPIVGRIDSLQRVSNQIRFEGVLNAERAATVADMIDKKELRGISLDPDDVELELQDANGRTISPDDEFDPETEVILVLTQARVRGGTILPMPAFVETELELFAVEDVTDSEENSTTDAVAASANPDALPPSTWFEEPMFDRPTPLTTSPEGQIFGHIALWETCHVGIKGVCATPPHSDAEYAFFMRGAVRTWCVECEREEVKSVGPITAGIGHASLSASKQSAVAHYDDTNYGVADVTAGEDSFGIWVAGKIRDSATKEQVENLMASSVSGDWRRINGNLELIAILAVNTPGYPVKRERALAHVAAGDTQTALITRPYGEPQMSPNELANAFRELKSTTIGLLRHKVHETA